MVEIGSSNKIEGDSVSGIKMFILVSMPWVLEKIKVIDAMWLWAPFLGEGQQCNPRDGIEVLQVSP